MQFFCHEVPFWSPTRGLFRGLHDQRLDHFAWKWLVNCGWEPRYKSYSLTPTLSDEYVQYCLSNKVIVFVDFVRGRNKSIDSSGKYLLECGL